MTVPALALVRRAEQTATQALLGDTIQLNDEAWRAPSALPGWSRAHLGTHIARNADALYRVVTGVLTGEPQFMYPSPKARDDAIELGAARTGLEIQQDLDETADRLEHALNQLTDERWEEPVALKAELKLPRAQGLLLHRLNEVTIHHIDLNLGVTFDDLDPTVAGWLLDHNLWRISTRYPDLSLRLRDDTETDRTIGSSPQATVAGSRTRLLGWLLGRLEPTAVTGATGITLPSL